MEPSRETPHRTRTSDDRILEFLRYVTARELKGVRFEKDDNNGVVKFIECTFVPLEDIKAYFEDREKINQVLRSIYDHERTPIAAETVYSSCLMVFCILLLIQRGDLIRYCVKNNIKDSRLPFYELPRDLGHIQSLDKTFWPAFEQQQWRFFPHKFEVHNINDSLSNAEILPICDFEKIDEGEGRVITKIVLHERYHSLRSKGSDTTEEHERDRNTFILKSLDGADGLNLERYESEVDAFQQLGCNGLPGARKGPPPEIIRCFGSFKHGQSYHILLEYADKGSLQDWLIATPIPSNQQDCDDLWDSMKAIATGVTKIHNVLPDWENGSIGVFKGYHQDLNLSNILVFSRGSQSRYRVNFKIADLGLTKFVRTQSYAVSASGEGRAGTRTFGSPEAQQARNSSNGVFKSGQSDDIWSLACIFSIVATWAVHGWPHVVRYGDCRRAARVKAVNVNSDTFHDDHSVLRAVQEWHEGLTNDAPDYDCITHRLWEHLLAPAFAPTSTRVQALAFQVAVTSLRRGVYDAAHRSSTMSVSYTTSYEQQLYHEEPLKRARTSGNLSNDVQGRRERNLSGSFAESSRRPHGAITDAYLHESPTQSAVEVARVADRYSYDFQILAGKGTQQQVPQEEARSTVDALAQSSIKLSSGTRITSQGSHETSPTNQRTSLDEVGRGKARGTPDMHDSRCPLHPSNKREIERMSVKQLFKWKEALDRHDGRKSGKTAIDKMIPYSNLRNDLGDRDHVFLFDNSLTMEQHWDYLCQLFRALAKFIKKRDKDGMEIYFMNGEDYLKKSDSTPLFDKVCSVGSHINCATHPEPALRKIWDDHKDAVRSGKPKSFFGEKKRIGLTIYIFTNGDWRSFELENLIEEIIVFLEKHGCLEHQVGIQFIQFGTGEKETDRLDALDRKLKGKGRMNRDIVDREPATGNVWKMLLGSVLPNFDEEDEDNCTCQGTSNQ